MDDSTRHEKRQPRLDILLVGSPSVELRNALDAVQTDPVDIKTVRDGKEAIAWLSDLADSVADAAAPDLILLQHGFESPDGTTILHAIKSSPRLNTVPVVVIGPDQSEAGTTYEHGGNAHVTAPDTADEYVDLMAAIDRFWFTWAQYPAECLSSNRK